MPQRPPSLASTCGNFKQNGRTEGTLPAVESYSDAMRIVGPALVIGLVVAAAASAKEIHPGDLRICGATQCHIVTEPRQARAFSSLLWGEGRVPRAPTPRVGSPVFQLRYPDGPAGAIINTTAIRVAGLNCGRFRRGVWYRLPVRLRGLTVGLVPRRLGAYVPPSC